MEDTVDEAAAELPFLDDIELGNRMRLLCMATPEAHRNDIEKAEGGSSEALDLRGNRQNSPSSRRRRNRNVRPPTRASKSPW